MMDRAGFQSDVVEEQGQATSVTIISMKRMAFSIKINEYFLHKITNEQREYKNVLEFNMCMVYLSQNIGVLLIAFACSWLSLLKTALQQSIKCSYLGHTHLFLYPLELSAKTLNNFM